MSKPNLARNMLIVSGAAVATLGLSACGGPAVVEAPATTQPSPVVDTSGNHQLEVTHKYYPNGTRRTSFNGTSSSDNDLRVIYAWCEGNDFVEQTTTDSYHAGTSISRTVGHAACDDGRLDLQDFQQHKK